ncbi:MAG: beta-N-acetylhexosaminidase [Sedimentisphaerales bacterium]|nr:beta-N-acetylhexosaminidase [Sedimentisphaerales bacterium]
MIAIIPQPVNMTVGEGVFTLAPDTVIVSREDTNDLAHYLKEVLASSTGYPLEIRKTQKDSHCIILSLNSDLEHLGTEGYLLKVTPDQVRLEAPRNEGIFYGIMTLWQLLPAEIFQQTRVEGITWQMPCVAIEDYPRFRWRGMHLDTARHFMPKEFVKKYIGLLALHKMNVFHWHLTEDQGWRIEIKKYPRLTEVGAWRKETLVGHILKKPRKFDRTRHGGFYSQADIREIVEYARRRYVTIVPEIEMPGHAQAAIAAYPELGNTGEQLEVWTTWGVNENIFNPNESTILFLQDVLSEVLELFPGEFIHIGGDEALKNQWEQSSQVQARIKELGLKDEHELQSYFIKRMDTFLRAKGRRLIGWDEILEGGLAPGATVMSWRGETGGIAAAQAGHDVVMAPMTHTYFDHYQGNPENEPPAIGGLLPLEKVYEFNPVPSGLTPEQARHILGAQGQVWTEYLPNPDKVEYMAFPRVCALAEVVWTPLEKKSYENFRQNRLPTHLQRLKILNVNYRPLD